MAPVLIAMSRLLIVFVLFQSVALYKIYAVNDDDGDHSNLSKNSLLPSYHDQISMKINDNAEDSFDSTEVTKSHLPWFSSISDQQRSTRKRSAFPFKSSLVKSLPQRRNNRPHFNPLAAAYKRCGDLPLPEDREICFKNAMQMLFVIKLRK